MKGLAPGSHLDEGGIFSFFLQLAFFRKKSLMVERRSLPSSTEREREKRNSAPFPPGQRAKQARKASRDKPRELLPPLSLSPTKRRRGGE